MSLKGRTIIILTQMVILVAFLFGMLLNYFLLSPAVSDGETLRLLNEIDGYVTHYYPECGCNPCERGQVDSVAALIPDPYGIGTLIIMDADSQILYDQGGAVGNGREILESRFGELSLKLLDRVRKDPDVIDCMEYDSNSHYSLYARYLPEYGLMYFYSLNYWEEGGSVMMRYLILLIVLSFGGLLIVAASFLLYRRIAINEHKAELAQRDLETASAIQRAMLPRGERHLMQIDLNARLVPANKVAGDLFVYLIENGMLYFCIGDVSGKGVPASLFMSKAVTLFRSFAVSCPSVGDLCCKLNTELCAGNEQDMFMTGIVGSVCLSNGALTYVNAGHEPPVIWDGKKESHLQFLKSEGDIPFGLMSDTKYNEEHYEIVGNGLLLLYTDGVSEARNPRGELLGRASLLDILEPCKSLGTGDLNSFLIDYVTSFESGCGQSDDITLLTMRNVHNPKRLELRNAIPELRKIAQFVEDVFKECPLSDADCNLVRAGLDEALTNCVLYAYDSPGQMIEVLASVEGNALVFTVRDRGKAFDPLSYVSEPADGIRVGGLGISIYRANFNDVQYRREGDSNVLKLKKYL